MIQGANAISATGMPESHGRAFQSVANETNCVIASRAVGKWATGLLLESYATKGFHNKAKSCPWGPMAGFVLADPRFTKNPDVESQRKALLKAVGDHAAETPLYITDARRKDLEGPLRRMARVGGPINEMIYSASPDNNNGAMQFVLRRTMNGPGAEGLQLWAVLYARSEARMSNDLLSPNRATAADDLLPVMAMVDAACPEDVRKTYRAATTGDYDLWAVFPHRDIFNAGKSRNGKPAPALNDRRMVPQSDRFRQPIKEYIRHEDPDRGNLTTRITHIRNLLNGKVRGEGYRGGDVVHHSDEAGRPLVSDIDFPCVAFTPNAPACLIDSVIALKNFIGGLRGKYVIGLNPGWQRQLGIDVSAGGSYIV